MGEATIRRATAEDVDRLAFVAAVTFPLACPPHTTREDAAAFVVEHLSADAFHGYLADPDRILLIAEEDGRAIGYTMLVLGEPHDKDVAAAITLRPTIELSKCYVLPGHHGRGVAGRLMQASIDAARECGAAVFSRKSRHGSNSSSQTEQNWVSCANGWSGWR